MPSKRNRVYIILLIALSAGYFWLFLNIRGYVDDNEGFTTPCIIKNVTGIACPSCGSTRAILLLLKGNVSGALYLNPIGLILLGIMVITPFWIIADFIGKKESLMIFYSKSEQFFKRKKMAVLAIILVLINWGWNIYKGL